MDDTICDTAEYNKMSRQDVLTMIERTLGLDDNIIVTGNTSYGIRDMLNMISDRKNKFSNVIWCHQHNNDVINFSDNVVLIPDCYTTEDKSKFLQYPVENVQYILGLTSYSVVSLIDELTKLACSIFDEAEGKAILKKHVDRIIEINLRDNTLVYSVYNVNLNLTFCKVAEYSIQRPAEIFM